MTTDAHRRYGVLLGDRGFRLLWSGQTTSQFGDAFYEIALVWLALEVGGRRPAAVGAVIFARALPYLFFGLIAGACADRWNRRRTMIAADLVRAVIVLSVPFLHGMGMLRLWHLVVVAFLLTTARSFFHPSLLA